MKSLRNLAPALLWATLAAAPMTAARADAPAPVWTGFFYMTGLTEACDLHGWSGTQSGHILYRPSGIGDNGPDSSLGFHWPGYALSLTRPNGRFTRLFADVRSTTIGGRVLASTGTRVRVTTHAPADIAVNTATLRLVGQIRTLEDLTGCDGDFEATLLPRR